MQQVGVPVPDGDTDKVSTAADAWDRLATVYQTKTIAEGLDVDARTFRDTYSPEVDYVVRLEFNPPLPEPFSYRVAWAKCDMRATVGFERLDLFHTARDQYGKRRYLHPKLTGAELERVKSGVLHALGFRNLTLTRDQQY